LKRSNNETKETSEKQQTKQMEKQDVTLSRSRVIDDSIIDLSRLPYDLTDFEWQYLLEMSKPQLEKELASLQLELDEFQNEHPERTGFFFSHRENLFHKWKRVLWHIKNFENILQVFFYFYAARERASLAIDRFNKFLGLIQQIFKKVLQVIEWVNLNATKPQGFRQLFARSKVEDADDSAFDF